MARRRAFREKKTCPLGKVYGLLEPGPVVLLTTARRGRANVMPMSWYTMLEFEPPLVGCVVSDRNFSFEALKKTKECAINIPTVELACQPASNFDQQPASKIDQGFRGYFRFLNR